MWILPKLVGEIQRRIVDEWIKDRHIQTVLEWLPLRRETDFYGALILESLADPAIVTDLPVLKTGRLPA